MNLETAGLVGFTTNSSNPRPSSTRQSDNAPHIGYSKPFWWLASSRADFLFDPTKRIGLEDWLDLFGEFYVRRESSSTEENDREHVDLEYYGAVPCGDVELCQFSGRIVDCARLLLQAGRFDLVKPLWTIAQNCFDDFCSNYLTEAVYGPLLPSTQTIVDVLQNAVDRAKSVLEDAFSHQNGLDTTFQFQMTLSLLSDFLLRLHLHLSVEADLETDMQWCHEFLRLLVHENHSPEYLRDGNNKPVEDTFDATTKSAHYLRETIKLAVFRNEFHPGYNFESVDGANNTDGDKTKRQRSGLERVTASLVEDVHLAQYCSTSIRNSFSIHFVVEDFLRPIWSVVKASLDLKNIPSNKEIPPSTLRLRSFLYIVYCIKGVLEGAFDLLETSAGDPHKLSPMCLSSLTQLDSVCFGIIKSLKAVVLKSCDSTTIAGTLLIPIMSASVAFSCHLGLYTKTQLRLEDLLGESNEENALASVFTYSELLWSQLVQLRSSLPLIQVSSAENKSLGNAQSLLPSAILEYHKDIASKIQAYGVYLHHLNLAGDWNALRQIVDVAQEARPGHHKKQLRGCAWLLESNSRPSFPLSFRRFVPLPTRSGIRVIGTGCHLTTFPLSLLVYGWKLSALQLDWCGIQELPYSFGLHLPNLKLLDISNNFIACLPDSVGYMKGLEFFIANDNLLTSLPKSAGAMSSLRVLELQDNSLEEFPMIVRKMKKLKELLLVGNNFLLSNTIKAQVVLDLPNLRKTLFDDKSEAVALVNTDKNECKKAKVNPDFSPQLRVFWEVLKEHLGKEPPPIASILENSHADSHFCLSLLELSKRHCLDYFARGACLNPECALLHDAREREIRKTLANRVVGLFRKLTGLEGTFYDQLALRLQSG